MDVDQIVVYKSKEFRKWLKNNHKKKNKIALILYKKHTSKPSPSHRELIEEAICFGWIDTTIKRLDEDRFLRRFVKRNKNSRWSKNTLSYARKLVKLRRMTPYGMEMYKLGLKKPTHDKGVPENPSMPEILKLALRKNRQAKENFKNYPPSAKKMFLRWLRRAKRDDTKAKRVKKIVELAQKGEKKLY